MGNKAFKGNGGKFVSDTFNEFYKHFNIKF